MSKKTKAAGKLKRLTAKRALKAANKVKYAERARLGITKESRRFKKKIKRKLVITIEHSFDCGNIGCKKCNPKARRTD